MLEERSVPGLDVINIVSFALCISKEELLSNQERGIGDKEKVHIERLLKERRGGKPLAYITKSREFFSEKIFVDERVLIPRPETELLVEEAIKILEDNQNISRIVDVGTGSGAIGIIVAKRTLREVVCVDVSIDALFVARRNAQAMQALKEVKLVCSDLFCSINRKKRFDMVLANLPYVASEEWDDVMIDVKNFEPREALYGGKGGVEIYRRFVNELPNYLEKDGYTLCEVGGDTQAEKIMDMLESAGIHTISKRDLSGNKRVIIGSWKSL
jgi:release factor glutamine methyltransferase